MKKVILVAAAFAMVAGAAAVASAEVNLSGDARVRLRYNDNGVTDSVDKWDSRVRVKVHATTEGGGYMKSRICFIDDTWGQVGDLDYGINRDRNVWADHAFIGFKVGDLDIAGGKMITSFSPWFADDGRADRFRILYKNKNAGTALAFTYDKKIYEHRNRTTNGTRAIVDAATGAPLVDANGNAILAVTQTTGSPLGGDKDVWGATLRQKLGDAAKLNARAVYVVDETTANKDGFKGSIGVEMNFAGNNIIIEQSYKEGDTARLGSDDQYGGYAEWNATFGSITPKVDIGYTADGFSADETFGWLMIGGDVPTSNISRVGLGGDTVFLGLSSAFQTTEKLSFQANAVFMDIDDNGTARYGENPIELSGQAKYKVGKGVSLLARAGWLIEDDGIATDDAFSAYGQMAIKF